MKKNTKFLAAALSAVIMTSSMATAFAASDDLESQILYQQKVLSELNDKKNKAANEELKKKISSLEETINALKKNSNYDTEGAIQSLAIQLNSLKEEVNAQTAMYEKISKTIDSLKEKVSSASVQSVASSNIAPATESKVYLVNPGPQKKVGYTQDAVNAQGNSTMLFAYSPSQLYKIYCRQGYLTDIELKQGEKVKFVGGGDTSAWSVIANDVNGVPHVYIKPVVDTSTTNLIITTDKHSYQLIVNTSDWYNPIVKWTYHAEDQAEKTVQTAKEDKLVTSTINTNPSNLDFAYDVKKKNTDLTPSAVFSDGKQTFIKFDESLKKAPVIFIKGKNRKQPVMVNYTIKYNCVMVDSLFEEVELRITDTEYLIIKHKKN